MTRCAVIAVRTFAMTSQHVVIGAWWWRTGIECGGSQRRRRSRRDTPRWSFVVSVRRHWWSLQPLSLERQLVRTATSRKIFCFSIMLIFKFKAYYCTRKQASIWRSKCCEIISTKRIFLLMSLGVSTCVVNDVKVKVVLLPMYRPTRPILWRNSDLTPICSRSFSNSTPLFLQMNL